MTSSESEALVEVSEEPFAEIDLQEEEDEEREQLPPKALLGSLLFVANKPIGVEKLAKVLKLDVAEIELLLEDLKELYSDDVHGFALHEIAGGWQFRTAPAAVDVVRRMIPKKIRKLSRAASETLAIIAYRQPVERAEVESIRGVDALPTLKTLLDANLVRIVGKQDAVGQPALYGTTTEFLEKFGLSDLSDLPSLHELEQLLNEPGESGEHEELEDENADEDEDGGSLDENLLQEEELDVSEH